MLDTNTPVTTDQLTSAEVTVEAEVEREGSTYTVYAVEGFPRLKVIHRGPSATKGTRLLEVDRQPCASLEEAAKLLSQAPVDTAA